MATDLLRSGIVASFEKRLTEALQINPALPFFIDNEVKPALLTGILKGSQETPGLVAAISAIKETNKLISLATSSIRELKDKTLIQGTVTASGGTTALYTVPAGKVFYLLELLATINATTNNLGIIHVGADTDDRLLVVASDIMAVYHTTDRKNVHLIYPKPLVFPAGTVINAFSDNANLSLYASIVGFTEDANA